MRPVRDRRSSSPAPDAVVSSTCTCRFVDRRHSPSRASEGPSGLCLIASGEPEPELRPRRSTRAEPSKTGSRGEHVELEAPRRVERRRTPTSKLTAPRLQRQAARLLDHSAEVDPDRVRPGFRLGQRFASERRSRARVEHPARGGTSRARAPAPRGRSGPIPVPRSARARRTCRERAAEDTAKPPAAERGFRSRGARTAAGRSSQSRDRARFRCLPRRRAAGRRCPG